MTLVKVDNVWINPQHVESVQKSAVEGTIILVMTSGDQVGVKYTTVDQVANILNAGEVL